MKHRISVLLIMMVAALGAMAQRTTFGYVHNYDNLVAWGTAKTETYNFAIRLADPGLAGAKVTGLRVPFNPDAANIADCRAYITRNLKLTSGKAVPDICAVDFSVEKGGWAEVSFDEPYTLTAEPVYIGFAFAITKLDTNGDKYPVMVQLGSMRDALYLGTNRTFRKWEEMGVSLSRTLPLEVILDASFSEANALGINYLDEQRIRRGISSAVKATVVNHGTSPVSNFDYEYTIGSSKTVGHIDLPFPLSAEFLGDRVEVEVSTPAQEDLGDVQGTLTITQVNGQPNADIAATAQQQLRCLKIVTVKRPLLEEFTGIWCGFCPRGYVGLLLLNERYPGMFVGASYHNGTDAMTISNTYPVDVTGLPAANLDRCHDTDAYRGDTSRDMGIEKTWLDACQEETPANVIVSAHRTEDENRIIVHTDYEFAEEVPNANYGVAYLVTADGLHGTTPFWQQHSYFPTAGPGEYGPEMDMFTKGPEYMFLVYDDVVIAQSGIGGKTIAGVIPASVHEEDVFGHDYEFDITTMIGYTKENLAQDHDRLNVIAILYDKTQKKVVNCNKVHVERYDDFVSGIHAATLPGATVPEASASGSTSTAPAYYTPDGKRFDAPVRGINIVRLSDGRVLKMMK